MNKKVGYGVALLGAAAGAGMLAAAVVRRKKREEIYHEAELKAMNELDEMMNDGCDDEALDCASCGCADVCPAAEDEAAEAAEPVEETEAEAPADEAAEAADDAADAEEKPVD